MRVFGRRKIGCGVAGAGLRPGPEGGCVLLGERRCVGASRLVAIDELELICVGEGGGSHPHIIDAEPERPTDLGSAGVVRPGVARGPAGD